MAKFKKGDRVLWDCHDPASPDVEITGVVIEVGERDRCRVRWDTLPKAVTRWEPVRAIRLFHPLHLLAEEAE